MLERSFSIDSVSVFEEWTTLRPAYPRRIGSCSTWRKEHFDSRGIGEVANIEGMGYEQATHAIWKKEWEEDGVIEGYP
jgi:hypothetical protein